jgi:hypothetical protein
LVFGKDKERLSNVNEDKTMIVNDV